ncbi:hypothetical protein FRC00_011773, partial [Tulasnella sp. 408]
MYNLSSTEHVDESSSSQPNRDLLFYTSLVFVLEPKENATALSADELKKAVLALDPQATINKDTRSKNYWLRASTKHKLDKFQKLVQKKASLGAFTIREVRPDSPEEDRIRGHITKWLASTARAPNDGSAASRARTARDPPTSVAADRPRRHPPAHQSQQGNTVHIHSRTWLIQDDSVSIPTYLDQSFPVIKPDVDEPRLLAQTDLSTQEDVHPEGMDVALGKRAAMSATVPDEDNAPVPDFKGPVLPETQAVERPRKRVRIDLRFNTYKYFEEWDEPGSISSSRNASGEAQFASTINELPPACLQRILVYSIPDTTSTSAKKYRSALYGLMLVCSKWKNAVESAPSLWSYLSNANPPRMIDTWIQRSSGVTITVKFDGSIEYPTRVESALERFVDKVTPHRLRWRSVSFSNVPPTWKSYLAVARAFNGRAPALTSAKITTIYGTTMPFVHSLRFFEGNAQALRHITLTGVVPNLSDVPVFANIESLCIIRPMGICPAYVLRMLARNNRLRSLELVEVRPSYARLFQNIETLELPELVYFELHLLKEDTVEMAQLFTRLRAPKCRRLDLAIDMDHLKHLRLAFNMLEFGLEAFLVELGAWMSHWIVLNRAISVDAWVDNIPGVDSSKSAFRW